jgi:hypothetical protein
VDKYRNVLSSSYRFTFLKFLHGDLPKAVGPAQLISIFSKFIYPYGGAFTLGRSNRASPQDAITKSHSLTLHLNFLNGPLLP